MILISSSHIKPGKVVHICLRKCQREDSEDSLDSQSRLLVESWVNEGHYQRKMVDGSWGPTSKVNLLSQHTRYTHASGYTCKTFKVTLRLRKCPRKMTKAGEKIISEASKPIKSYEEITDILFHFKIFEYIKKIKIILSWSEN